MGDKSKRRGQQHTLGRQKNIQKYFRQKWWKIPVGKRTDISGYYGNKRFSLSCSSPWREGWRRASWRECCPDHSPSQSRPLNRALLAAVLFASPEAGSVRPQPRLYTNVFSKVVDQWGAGSGKFEPKNRKILQLKKNSYFFDQKLQHIYS